MFHPPARGFGLCSLLVKIMMVYAIKDSGRDSPDEEYLAHVVDGRRPTALTARGRLQANRTCRCAPGDIDPVIDHMIKGESLWFICRALSSIARRSES
jgi:hypothetical protein